MRSSLCKYSSNLWNSFVHLPRNAIISSRIFTLKTGCCKLLRKQEESFEPMEYPLYTEWVFSLKSCLSQLELVRNVARGVFFSQWEFRDQAACFQASILGFMGLFAGLDVHYSFQEPHRGTENSQSLLTSTTLLNKFDFIWKSKFYQWPINCAKLNVLIVYLLLKSSSILACNAQISFNGNMTITKSYINHHKHILNELEDGFLDLLVFLGWTWR